MNRTYEIMFIVRPDVEEADLDKLIEGFSANVTAGNGEVKTVEKMGRRRLAYTVRKFNDGFYVLLTIAAEGKLITEIERRLRVSEPVIKFITVRMDEEEKRLAKVKAIRDTKVKRSAQPIQPQHQPVPAAAPGACCRSPCHRGPCCRSACRAGCRRSSARAGRRFRLTSSRPRSIAIAYEFQPCFCRFRLSHLARTSKDSVAGLERVKRNTRI